MSDAPDDGETHETIEVGHDTEHVSLRLPRAQVWMSADEALGLADIIRVVATDLVASQGDGPTRRPS